MHPLLLSFMLHSCETIFVICIQLFLKGSITMKTHCIFRSSLGQSNIVMLPQDLFKDGKIKIFFLKKKTMECAYGPSSSLNPTSCFSKRHGHINLMLILLIFGA